jgi:hypothetical protein
MIRVDAVIADIDSRIIGLDFLNEAGTPHRHGIKISEEVLATVQSGESADPPTKQRAILRLHILGDPAGSPKEPVPPGGGGGYIVNINYVNVLEVSKIEAVSRSNMVLFVYVLGYAFQHEVSAPLQALSPPLPLPPPASSEVRDPDDVNHADDE